VDIYAAGLILLELSFIFKTNHHRTQAITALRKHHQLDAALIQDPELEIESRLILKMTSHNPLDRPSANDILTSSEFLNWAE
jgi:hypothetical protein